MLQAAMARSLYSGPANICTFLCSGKPHLTEDCQTDASVAELLHRIVSRPCFQQIFLSDLNILVFVWLLSLVLCRLYWRASSKPCTLNIKQSHQTARSHQGANKWRIMVALTLVSMIANVCLSMWLAWLRFSQPNSHVAVYEILFSTTRAGAWLASLLILAPKRDFLSPFRMTLTSLRGWWILNLLSSIWILASAISSYIARDTQHFGHELMTICVAIVAIPIILALLLLLSRTSPIPDSTRASHDLAEPLVRPGEEVEIEKLSGYANAGIISKALFLWLNPLIAQGSRAAIQTSDVPFLKKEDNCESLFAAFEEKWKWQRGTKTLAFGLLRSLWNMFVVTGLLAVLKLCVMYVGPLMIQQFIDFTAKKDSSSWTEGARLVLVLFLAKCTEVLADHQRNFILAKMSLAGKSLLIAAVFRKSLRLSTAEKQNHGTGQIVNYMSVDVQEVASFTTNLHDLWIMPLQIIMALVILFRVVGLSTLAGLTTMAVILAICLWIASYQQHFWVNIMASKDSRLKVTSEALNNMKIIKMQAWQDWFCQKIEEARRIELSWISKIMYLASLSIFLLWLSPLAVSVITFGTCVLLRIALTSGRVFTAIATFRILQEPLRSFPQTIMAAAQAYVSLKRLVNYFESEEIDQNTIQRLPCGEDFAITVKEASFKWEKNADKCTLTNINLQARTGSLVAIIGTVGSGKSALLACILGEMEKISGSVLLSGQTAYVAQTPWIQNGTIQENILFGKPMNQTFYQKTLRACALKKDLSQMPHGDQTEIGERGINLSGGQKQRIQLARAVYQDADIYLLDDVFSAVDAHTGTKLFWECVRGALSSKTVLLVTHQVEFLHGADRIMVMKEGEIVQTGKYEDLLKHGVDFGSLIDAHNTALQSMNVEDPSIGSEGMGTKDHADYSISPGSAFMLSTQGSPMRSVASSPLSSSPSTLLQQGYPERQISQRRKIKGEYSKDLTAKKGNLIEEEERATGHVDQTVYWAYATKVFGGVHVVFLILIQTGWQALQIASDFWLADATSLENQAHFKPTRFITVYTGLAIGSGIFVLLRTLLITFASLKTTQAFYVTMLQSVFQSPMSFFDTTPTGRILSRSSTDQVTVDFDVPFSVGSLLAVGFQLLGVLFVTSCITWELVVVVLPLAWISISYQRYFICTSRELTRLGSITQAPVIHHFSETISGLMTVRAFGYERKFNDINNERVNTNLRIAFHNAAANEWFGARIEILGIGLLSASALLLVLLPSDFIQPELVGLCLSYGLAINDTLFYVVLISSMLEQKMVSVERILQYSGLTKEQPADTENKHPDESWPSHGSIAVQGLQLRYRPDTPLVLKGLTFTIKGGENLGVVGLTGSGKSSLIQALFRLVEPSAGKILIDGVDITTISLNDLRSRLSIIPQEPTLFEGSIRTNLDPLSRHTDQEIWEVLEKCQLEAHVKGKEEKLDSQVAENGENWSMGQRQLFCLGRALLKHSRILVLDEATASVDTQTDLVLQNTIKTEFSSCTIISIAHRIPSVMDSDKVLALESGKVREFGSPAALMHQQSSLFASLVHEYWNRSKTTQFVTEQKHGS